MKRNEATEFRIVICMYSTYERSFCNEGVRLEIGLGLTVQLHERGYMNRLLYVYALYTES